MLYDGRREFDLDELIESEGDYFLAVELMEDYINEIAGQQEFEGNLVVSMIQKTWQGYKPEVDLGIHETLQEVLAKVLEAWEANDGYDNFRMILEDKKLRFEFVHHDGTHVLHVRKEGH
jgi:hypothetical protein